MTRKQKETKALLDKAHADAPRQKLRSLAVSMASFIAALDTSSSDVADYIEQRLEPLARDARFLAVLTRMAQDGRKLTKAKEAT